MLYTKKGGDNMAETTTASAPKRKSKSRKDRIAVMDAVIADMKRKRKELEAAERAKDRKARTRRLIEIGAIFEKHLGRSLEPEEAQKLIMEYIPREN
jgi:hypothetical protein